MGFRQKRFMRIPGQPPSLQFSYCVSGPRSEHSFPPGLGAGLVHDRRRLLRPSPQVLEHADQEPHSE